MDKRRSRDPQPLQLPSLETPEQERILYVEDEEGFTVRVPESKLEAWQRGQQEVKRGEYKPTQREAELLLSALERLARSAPKRRD